MKETVMLPTTTFTTQTKLVDSGAFSPRTAVLNPYTKIKKLGKISGVLFILLQGIISWVLSLSLVYTVHCLFVAIPKQDLRLFVTTATEPNIKYGCRCAKTTMQQFLAERIVQSLITYVQRTWSSNTLSTSYSPQLFVAKKRTRIALSGPPVNSRKAFNHKGCTFLSTVCRQILPQLRRKALNLVKILKIV